MLTASNRKALDMAEQPNVTLRALGLAASLCLTWVAMSSGAASPATLPIIPGALGFGIDTVAGSGRHLSPARTTVIQVTNLNADGPGSLKEALEAETPRTVVFAVSGAIHLTKMPRITHPYITVAGQTAPSPGISIHGAGVYVMTHDVLLQHLRIRPGDDPVGPSAVSRDCLTIYDTNPKGNDVYNVVVDHCSLTWAVDENINTWSDPHDGVERVTIRHCLIAEGLRSPLHPKGGHSKGLLIGQNDRDIFVHANLFAHNSDRNPVGAVGSRSLIVNNFIHNPQTKSIHFYPGEPLTSTVVGNAMRTGPSTNANIAASHWAVYIPSDEKYGPVNPASRIYVRDNWSDNAVTGDTDNSVLNQVGDSLNVDTPTVWIPDLAPKPSRQVPDWVTENAGARPNDRDDTDARIIRSVAKKGGKVIKSIKSVGGWPDVPRNSHELMLPEAPMADDGGDGYTNLEEFLHELAAKVE